MQLEHDTVIVVDAQELIETGLLYGLDSGYQSGRLAIKNHTYEVGHDTPTERYRNIFDCMLWKWRECSKEFVRDIKTNGFNTPITMVLELDGTIAVWNGHHRLAVAYNLGIPVPIFIASAVSPWNTPYQSDLGMDSHDYDDDE